MPRLELRGDLSAARSGGELASLARELGIAEITAALLVARGVHDADARERVLSPSLRHLRPPEGMAGFEPALELLIDARKHGWRVGVFGDYDVDGVTTAAILGVFLECMGIEVVTRVATREEGYGFQLTAARALVDAGVQMVVTGDCGTSDHEALDWLQSRGIPTIVIDHHQVPETMPAASALINPHQPSCRFAFKGMCSAGVAFYLCARLRTVLREREPSSDLPDPRAFLDLVALGTVCDLVPLVDVNRVFVHQGLRLLDERRRPGIRAMLERAGVPPTEAIDEGHLGFQLGPRINAPGRLGTADPSLRLLRARSSAEAEPLAAQVEAFNQRRRASQDEVVEQARAQLDGDPRTATRHALVAFDERWLPGIVGIAASGLVERFRRPALVLAVDRELGEARGSARTFGNVDVRAALHACAHLLGRYGGHKAAAGVSLRPEGIPELVEAFDAAVAAQTGAAPPDDRMEYDGEVTLAAIDDRFLADVRRLAPYGMGFAQPLFVCTEARVVRAETIGTRHLKLFLEQGGATREAMLFGRTDVVVGKGDTVSLLFTPTSQRRGQHPQLRIQEIW